MVMKIGDAEEWVLALFLNSNLVGNRLRTLFFQLFCEYLSYPCYKSCVVCDKAALANIPS